MKRFTDLFIQLDRTNKTNEKVEALKSYFLTAPDEDKIWALAVFTGRRPPSVFKRAQLHEWALELSGIPDWLFRESYGSVGDMAETISLILPTSASVNDRSLSQWFRSLIALSNASDDEKKKFLTDAWRQLSQYEVFVFNKLLMGSLRIGVSQTLVIRAIGEAIGQDPAVISHRIMGKWDPKSVSFHDLIHAENSTDELSKPYPFYLAYAIEGELEDLGTASEWFVEWKWDGIRSQLILRRSQLFVWSRGEELVTEKFPELHAMRHRLPEGTVIDGEILCFANDRPLPFNVLQTRIGRKNVTKKILADAPVVLMGYDVLEYGGRDLRNETQEYRRHLLEQIAAEVDLPVFRLSPLVDFKTWDDLRVLHKESRERGSEGFMLKRKEATYQVGRKKGNWWKWKVDPLSVDAVLVYAAKGNGRRAELYTDYTFAVWDGDKLIPFAKAYSGLTAEEIKEVDKFIRQNTLEKFGPVRTVKPELVFEIGFEGINKSTRHKSGIAVRFPRMLR
ncbi:MAG TPA: ATP-dependent DNA ligase, partial [Cyclobacteriaceae bacterium]|nr:ATP-dependent DNA ligase [Cyclobacteriaceae bacterium]